MLVPKLRFKREDGTDYPRWNNQKLSSVSSRVTRKNKGNITDIPLTIASLYGLVDQREYFKKTIASQNMEGYYLLHNGEFAYNKSYSKGFDFGAIKRLDRYDCGALSTLYICFAVNNKVDSDFMTHYFDSQKWNKEVSIRCAEGARNHGLLNISTDDFFDIDITLPIDLEEQQKIADFLSTVDEVIAQSEAEVQNLEQQKKATMQKIFSQEVRFKREDGTDYPEWEKRKFVDIYDEASEGATPSTSIKEYYENGTIPFVKIEDTVNKYIYNVKSFITQEGLDNCSAWLIPENSVIFTNGATIGNVSINKIPVATKQGILGIVPKQFLLYEYLYYWLSTSIFINEVHKRETKGTFATIILKSLNEIAVYIPCLEEQQKISDLLSAYDEAISYAKQELDKWKELKKGLLQQMFV